MIGMRDFASVLYDGTIRREDNFLYRPHKKIENQI